MFTNNKFIIAIVTVIVLLIASSTIFASTITTDWPTAGQSIGKVEKVAKNVWATVIVIVQILAISAVIFAGLRYMFTSAEGKASIKKEMSYLALGAILVFATTTVVDFVVKVVKEVME